MLALGFISLARVITFRRRQQHAGLFASHAPTSQRARIRRLPKSSAWRERLSRRRRRQICRYDAEIRLSAHDALTSASPQSPSFRRQRHAADAAMPPINFRFFTNTNIMACVDAGQRLALSGYQAPGVALLCRAMLAAYHFAAAHRFIECRHRGYCRQAATMPGCRDVVRRPRQLTMP